MIPNNEKSSKDIIETGLGSIGKIKILKSLAEEKKFLTIYAIHKKTHLKREDIKRNLKELIQLNWIVEKKVDTFMYQLNLNNQYIEKLVIFFRDVGYMEQQKDYL
ncbi:MAG: hypothetical protein ACPKPY_02780 [Nitrososphaeraceae archaeon]